MNQDLLTTPNPNELEYADNLANQAQADLQTIMQQGRVPPWIELDSVLQRDEYRLLDLIETRSGYVMGEPVTVQYGVDSSGLIPVNVTRRVDSLTRDCGFDSPSNCKATVNRCVANGWIEWGVCEITGRERLDLTRMGRFVKDLAEHDAWFDMMED